MSFAPQRKPAPAPAPKPVAPAASPVAAPAVTTPAPKPTTSAAAPVAKAPATPKAAPAANLTEQAPKVLKSSMAGVPIEPAHSPLERQADEVSKRVVAGEKVAPVKSNPTIPGARPAAAPATAPATAANQAPMPSTPVTSPAPSPGQTGAVRPPDAGQPLPDFTRQTLESRMGTDFSNVRIHTGPQAQQQAQDINARAFTSGSDVWLGAGESPYDVELMAHELTHVMQQREGGVPARVMRLPAPTTDPKTLALADGQVNAAGTTLTFAELDIPGFKMVGHRAALYAGREATRQRGYNSALRGDTQQRAIWHDGLSTTAMEGILARKEEDGHGPSPELGGHLFKPRLSNRSGLFFAGRTLQEVARGLTLPGWERGDHPAWRENRGDGASSSGYQADHIVELQLANYPSDPWGNTLPNMELLDAGTNMACGTRVDSSIDRQVVRHIAAAGYAGNRDALKAEIKRTYELKFQHLNGALEPANVGRNLYWRREEVEAGEHLACVVAASASEVGLTDGRVMIFPDASGGFGKHFKGSGTLTDRSQKEWLAPLRITSISPATGPAAAADGDQNLGVFNVRIPGDDPTWEAFTDTIDIPRLPGAPLAGYPHPGQLRRVMDRLEKKSCSPIEISAFGVGVNGGVRVAGRIIPTLPFLHNAPIDFRVQGDNVGIYKTFVAGELALPPPFHISDSSLTVFAGVGGGGPHLGVEGEVNFEVQGLGRGQVGGRVATDAPLSVFGSFDFDTRYFDPARIAFTYAPESGQWSATGDIGLKPNLVPGIESATGHVQYDGTTLSGSLTVVPKIRAIQQGQLEFSHSEAEGSRFAGTLTLSDQIPNVRSGQLQAVLTKAPGSEDFSFSATGDLESGFAGFTQRLHVEYRDGGFVVEGQGNFARGMLSGSLMVGATNYAVDDAGQRGTAPTENITAYGTGQVSVTLTPWLVATGRIRFLPNGELELFGELALPPVLNVFDEKSYNRRLASLNLDIPIVGVAVAGQRIGIFATIGAGLDLSAGIGPGQLRDTALSVTYNPSHEDQTAIHGHARFVVPAHAGLRMFVRGALGAGIPVISAELGLEAGGEIGLAGEASAEATVDWSPGHGLVLDALGSVFVEPKFKFDLTGFAEVTADLWVTEIELYSKRWNLASFEVGSNLRFGVEFPMHYQEGQPFDVNWDQVHFITPDVDVGELMHQVIDRVV